VRKPQLFLNWHHRLSYSVSIIIALFALISCQTVAQREAIQLQQNSLIAKQKTTECVQRLYDNPEYSILLPHMPLVLGGAGKEPSLNQLTDNNIPTQKEIRAIVALHNELTSCRTELINELMKINPRLVPIVLQGYASSDNVMVDLIRGKITYGEANKRRVALENDMVAKATEANQQLLKGLQASNQTEIAHRQRAYEALTQFGETLSHWGANQQQIFIQINR
jgi:hypothetical protein